MKIYVTDQDGTDHVLDAVSGWRVMEIIRDSGLSIKAECGGACACATCHVYVAPEWINKIPPMNDEERHMMDDAFYVQENSRLSCQIIMDETLDGLRVVLARD
jgi:2Fe-2S ferredoxin